MEAIWRFKFEAEDENIGGLQNKNELSLNLSVTWKQKGWWGKREVPKIKSGWAKNQTLQKELEQSFFWSKPKW